MSEERVPESGNSAGNNSGNTASGNERPATGSSPPADDLRSLIAATVADEKKAAAAAPPAAKEGTAPSDTAEGRRAPAGREDSATLEAEPPPSGREETGEDKPGAERERDATGKFVPPAATGAAEAPAHWSAADKAQFNALPEAARTPFLDMYRRMESGFTPKLQRGAALERDYGDVDRNIFTPAARQLLNQRGETPGQMINNWAMVENGLIGAVRPDASPEERRQAFEVKSQIAARIIHNYGIDPGRVAAILHELRGSAPAPGNGQGYSNGNGNGYGNGAAAPPGIDPILHQRLQTLEAQTQELRGESLAERQRREAAEYARASDQIAAFGNETDAQGQLKHPFFAELEEDMTILARSDRNQGKAPVLEDLYTRALWANQSTRAKQLELEAELKAKRAAEERRAKSEQALRAGSSVTGAPGPGQTAQPAADMSLRDTIKANMGSGRQTSGGPGRI